MEKAITKAALINGILTTANCAIDANGFVTIKYLPKFNSSWLKLISAGVYRKDTLPNAEVVQVTNIAPVTVVALQKYKLQETTINSFIESWSRQPNYYGYTAPAVLGAQATENHNMFVSLAYKINNSGGAKATAYPLITVTHAAGNFIIGATLTGATSGATGIVVANTSTTVVVVGMISTTLFSTGENLSDGTNTYAQVSQVIGSGLRIVDDAGYYSNNGARGGINTFTAAAGFASTDVTVQNKIYNVTHAAGNFVVGETLVGATTGARALILRNVSTTVVMVAYIGTTVFAGGENLDDQTGSGPYAYVSQAIVAQGSTVSTLINGPTFAYAQGQGADLLADVPRGSRDSSNLNSGSFEGPQGDTPLVGTEYVSSDWAINWPVSVDNIGESTTTIPAPMRLWTDLASYNGGTVNTRLDAVGLTD